MSPVKSKTKKSLRNILRNYIKNTNRTEIKKSGYFVGNGRGNGKKYFYENRFPFRCIQACLEFAAQLGQIADDTLEAVERRRILENEKRKELLEKGITVYGLSNFSVPAYIQYELTRFRLDFVAEKALIKRSYNYSMITSKDMVSFWNEHRELFTRYQGDSFSYDEVAMVIRKRIREKEYEQEIQNILRKQH